MNFNTVVALFSGVLAGVIHALTGPDHVAALAPFFTEQRIKSWLIGLKWGIGHSSGVWILGILVFFLRQLIPVDLLSSWGERLVGITLIGLGIWSAHRGLRNRVHSHTHIHDGSEHVHFHIHHPHEAPHDGMRVPHSHRHAPVGIGILHGLAGSSHLFGILPALAFSTSAETVGYLLGFGFGAILGMTAFSTLLGKLVHQLMNRSQAAYQIVQFSVSSLAILVGIFWISITF